MSARWISLCLALALPISSPAQSLPPSVFGGEVILLPGQARAQILLLRLPLRLASELLLQDDRQADYWDLTLPPLMESGQATEVQRLVLEGPSAQPLSNRPQTPPETFTSGLHAEVSLEGANAQLLQADWRIEWGDPQVEQPHNGLHPSPQHRLLELTANQRLSPAGQCVLLGAQTEHGGTSVILALGQLSAEDVPAAPDLPSRSDSPVSTWLFTLPLDRFFQWQLLRTPLEEDLATFHQWLGESAISGSEVKLEALSGTSSQGITSLEQRWVAPVRFGPFLQPDGSLLPKSTEDQRFSSGYSQETSDSSLDWSWPVTGPRHGSFPLGTQLPPLRLRLQDAEGFFTSATASRDSPELVRAWQGWDGRMRALFARRRPPVPSPGDKPPAARAIHSLWCIQASLPTAQPLSWADSHPTAEALLAAVREGSATVLDAASATCMSAYVGVESHTTQGFLQLGKGLLEQTQPGGSRLCPEILRPGHSLRTWSVDWQEKGSLNIHELRSAPQLAPPPPPQPQVPLPLQERSLVQASVDLPAHQAVVIASSRRGQEPTRWWIAKREGIDPEPLRKTPPQPARFLHIQVIHRPSGTCVHEARLALSEQVETSLSHLTQRSTFQPSVPAAAASPWAGWKVKEARSGLEFELSLSAWEASYHAPEDPRDPSSPVIRHRFKGQQPQPGKPSVDERPSYRLEVQLHP